MSRARLLRGPAAQRARLIPGPEFQALAEAADIVTSARAEAEALRASARAEAERLRSEALAEGKERGLAAVTELLVAARASASKARRQATDELRVLAVRIAGKLLGRALELDPSLVVDLTTQALSFAGEPKALRLRCHPDDLALLESGRPKLLDRCRSISVLRIEADAQVPQGGCILDSELGQVDARLAVQLDAIDRALRSEGA